VRFGRDTTLGINWCVTDNGSNKGNVKAELIDIIARVVIVRVINVILVRRKVWKDR
jgi:hypothetical protein